jgi:hypothetical protein
MCIAVAMGDGMRKQIRWAQRDEERGGGTYRVQFEFTSYFCSFSTSSFRALISSL